MGRMIFKPAARYPADPRAVFVLALSVFSGITALALNVAPQSLESLLPSWAVIAWGIILAGGSAITLAGMAFQTLNGIITEQIGNVCVAAATIFYSSVAFLVVGPSSLQNVGIILAWGLACGLRWVQLQALINSAYRRQMKQRVVEQVYAEIESRREHEAPGRHQEGQE